MHRSNNVIGDRIAQFVDRRSESLTEIHEQITRPLIERDIVTASTNCTSNRHAERRNGEIKPDRTLMLVEYPYSGVVGIKPVVWIVDHNPRSE